MAITTRTILQIIQDASLELGLPTVSSVVNSTDTTVRQLLAFAHRTGDELQSRYDWPQLSKEYTFDLVDSEAAYALPDDFDRFIFRTFWDRDNFWELDGPLSPQEWQWYKSGAVSSFPRRRYRFKGFADEQFFLDPTPDAGDAGETMAFEYQTQTWIIPTQWVTSTEFAALSYCFNDGNIYQTTAGGTTGSTAPTHTSGSSSDGGVTWTYISASYNRFLADTDIPLIDEDIVNLGIQWRWMAQKGLNYQHIIAQYEAMVVRQASALSSAPTLNITGSSRSRFISSLNVPDSGFGN